MMLPSWFTKLRDVNGGSKQNKLYAPSPAAERRGKDPTSFAKSWSLRRANSKAKGTHTEIETNRTCNETCSSTRDEPVHLVSAENVCNLASQRCKDGMTPLVHRCEKLDSWGCDFVSISSCKIASTTVSSKEMKALMQKGHGVSDNDTEDFAFTSENRSSFCSETSSADSSVNHKIRGEEKGNQDEQNWRAGDLCIMSSCPVKELEENCGTGEQDGSHCAEYTTLIPQKGAQMRRDTWRGRGSLLFSYLTMGRRRSVGDYAGSRNVFNERNAGVKRNPANCSVVANDCNLKKKNGGKTCSAASEWEKEYLASRKNISSKKHNRSNPQTLGKSLERSSPAAEANLDMALDHGDMHRCTDTVEESRGDRLAATVWLERRNERHSTAENESATASSGFYAPPENGDESKHRLSSMRRRRHRGASISAELPSDLQGVVGDSLALVKMSDDPYQDFRQSIYEMIMEKDLEGSIDVEELLYCYLTLNAPEHHALIEEVFSDVYSAILMTLR